MKEKFNIYYVPKEPEERKISFIYCISDNKKISASRYFLMDLNYINVNELKKPKISRIINTMYFTKWLNCSPIKVETGDKLYKLSKELFIYAVSIEKSKKNIIEDIDFKTNIRKKDFEQWIRIAEYINHFNYNRKKVYNYNSFLSELRKSDIEFIENNSNNKTEDKSKKK